MPYNLQIITANLDLLPRNFSPDVPAGRVETGPLIINDDWPSVHIRGDNASFYAMHLDIAVDLLNSCDQNDINIITTIESLKGLSMLLKSCLNKFNNEDHDIGC